jgi:regulatory protein
LAGSRRARSSSSVPSPASYGGRYGPADAGEAVSRGSASGPNGTAKDRALRLLGVRWRSRAELRFRLSRVGFAQADVERALDDLERVGLIDDARFAREVVKDQTSRRLAGDRAIRAALRQKGLGGEEVDRALAGAGDEGARAYALAERQAARMRDVPLDVAHRRIVGMLLRRGYASEVALEACRRVLPERPGPEHADP